MSFEPPIIASLGEGGNSVVVANRTTGEVLFKLFHEDQRFPGAHLATRIWSVAVSPDGSYLATAGRDTTARLWSGETGRLIRVITAQLGFGDTSNHKHEGGYIWSVAFSYDGRFVATGGYGGHLRVWEVPTCHLVFEAGPFGGTQNPPGVQVAFDAAGKQLIAREQFSGETVFDLPTVLWPDLT